MPSREQHSTATAGSYHLLSRSMFLFYQGMLLLTAIAVCAIFYLLQGHADVLATFTYTLVAGNIVAFFISQASPLFDQPFPRNWIVYLALLLPVAFVASIAASLTIWLIVPVPVAGLPTFVRENVPFGVLISFISGVGIYGYLNTRVRMEVANAELAQEVHRGQEQIASHTSELRAAFEIQSSLLPRTIPQIRGVEISCSWQPARTVSGDFFDVLPLSESRIAFCLADVSGKGISAALITANVQATLRAFAGEEPSPAGLCRRLNQALCESLPSGRFVTFAYGVLDRSSLTLTYELAGHAPPLLLREGVARSLPGSGPVLGLLPGAQYSDQVVQLHPGDRLVLSTDGVTEAFSPSGEEFGDDRLLAAVTASASAGAHTIRAAVLREVTEFAENNFHDDASLMVIAITA